MRAVPVVVVVVVVQFCFVLLFPRRKQNTRNIHSTASALVLATCVLTFCLVGSYTKKGEMEHSEARGVGINGYLRVPIARAG